MNILISTNENFIHSTEIMVYSLCKSNTDNRIDIYLAQLDLPVESIKKLEAVIGLFDNAELHVIQIPRDRIAELEVPKQYSSEIFYRIIALDYLPEDMERIMYLDVDTIVKKDITEIYNHKFGEQCPFVVCEDTWSWKRDGYDQHIERCGIPDGYTYFNTGFMLMNLKYIRHHRSVGYIVDAFVRENGFYLLPDQDVLNHMYYDRVEYVPATLYNCTPDEWWIDARDLAAGKIRYVTYGELNSETNRENFIDVSAQIRENAVVIHFMAFLKPWLYREWIYPDLEPYANLWFEYEKELAERLS